MFSRFSKMLVVDDSAVQRRILLGLLNALGYGNVDEAADGGAALAMMETCSYRLVLSDWDMAPMDGAQLLRRLRADRRWARMPFIMVTAQAHRKFADVARDDGVTFYIAKPFTAEVLAERIARLDKPGVA